MTNINYDQKVNNAESNFVKNPPAKRNGPNSGSQNESFQKNKPHFFQEIIMKEKKRMREMEEKKKKEREEALFVRSKCSAWQKYVPK